MSLLIVFALATWQHRPPQTPMGDAKNAIKVTVDDRPIVFPDTQPMLIGAHVLVPMRGVFEELGAELKWDPAQEMVSAHRGRHHVEITLGRKLADVDGALLRLDQPAITVGGRTMVPLRFLGQALGVQVDWDPAVRTVSLVTHRRDK